MFINIYKYLYAKQYISFKFYIYNYIFNIYFYVNILIIINNN